MSKYVSEYLMVNATVDNVVLEDLWLIYANLIVWFL